MATIAQRARTIEGVELLRGVAALGVVVAHAIDVADLLGTRSGRLLHLPPAADDFGAAGVDLFFVISGFIMAHVIGHGGPAPSAADFCRRRIARILPLFLIASIPYAALLCLFGQPPTAAALLNTITLIPLADGTHYTAPPLFVGWTLAFEASFYLIVAAVLAARVAQRQTVLLALVLLAGGVGLVVHPPWAPAQIMLNPMMFEFALGVTACIAWRHGVYGRIATRGLIALLAAFLVARAIRPIDLSFSVHFAHVVAGETGLLRSAVWGLPWALVLLGTLDMGSDAGRLRRAMSPLGTASYSLYLAHAFVMLLAARLDPAREPNPYMFVALLVTLSVALGLAVHHAIERPLLTAMRGDLKTSSLSREGAGGGCARLRA